MSLEEADQLVISEESPKTHRNSVIQVAFSIANCIVGAGIIGLPYALLNSGFFFGCLLMIFVSILCNFSLYSLVLSGKHLSIYDYPTLVHRTLGSIGFFVFNIAILTSCLGACIIFLTIIGDVFPIVMSLFFTSPLFLSRSFAILLCSSLGILPQLFFKSLAPLSRIAMISTLFIPIIALLVSIRAPIYSHDNYVPITFFGEKIFSSLGVMSFAFISAHATFFNYKTLKNPSLKRWAFTTIIGSKGALLLSMLFSISGFLSFGSSVNANILDSFPSSDPWINLARFLILLKLFASYPAGFYPARECIIYLFSKDASITPRNNIITTSLIFIFTVLVALLVDDLGILFQLVGALSSSLLAYAFPGLILIFAARSSYVSILDINSVSQLNPTELKSISSWYMKIASYGLVVFGLISCIAGTYQTLM